MKATRGNLRKRLPAWAMACSGVCLAAAGCGPEPAAPEPATLPAVTTRPVPAPAPTAAEVVRLAETDHVALLERCLAATAGRWRDYTCTFIKQERLGGRLGEEQWMAVKFRESPFSVAMTWLKNPGLGDRALYVEGKWRNHILARPTNRLARAMIPGGTSVVDPTSQHAKASSLRPITAFGLRHSLAYLLEVYRRAKAAGELKEAYGGIQRVAGRETVVLIRRVPPGRGYPAPTTVSYIDIERLVPVVTEGYAEGNELRYRYVFRDVTFDVGLGEEDFLPEANDLTSPH